MKSKNSFYIIIFLLLVPYLFFFQPVFLGKTFAGTDIASFFYPFKVTASEMYRTGQIHLWDPYIFAGMPTGAEIQTGLFYPLNLLFAALSVFRAIVHFIAFHMFLTALFMFLYLRQIGLSRAASLFGALAFAYNGFSLMHVDQLSMLSVCTWLPLILLFIEKASKEKGFLYPTLAGMAMGLQFLGGHVQMSAITCIVCAFYVGFKLLKPILSKDKIASARIATIGISILLIGIALASVALIPFLESYSLSLRSGDDYEASSAIHASLGELQTFIVPELREKGSAIRWFGGTGETYAGVVPIFLALFAAIYVRGEFFLFYAALAAFSFFASFGSAFPLHYILYHLVPFYGALQIPIRFMFPFMFSISSLAAMAIDRIAKQADEASKYTRGLLIFGSLVLCLYLVVVLTSGGRSFLIEATEGGITAPLRFLAVFGAFASSLYLFSSSKLPRWIFAAALIIITLFDLLSFGTRYFKIGDESTVSAKPAFFNFLEQDRGIYRVSISLQDFPPNLPIVCKFQSISGYSPIILKDFIRYVIFDATKSPDLSRVETGARLYVPAANDTVMKGLLNVKYNVYPLEKDGMYYIGVAPLKNYYPRAFLVSQYEIVPNRQEILPKLAEEGFDPRRVMYLENSEDLSGYAFGSTGEGYADVLNFSPDKIDVMTRSGADMLLYLSEIYYPGWKAYVDGVQTDIYRANYLFRSIPLKAGEHFVSLIYDPLSFKLGKYISLFSLAICIGLIGFGVYARRRKL